MPKKYTTSAVSTEVLWKLLQENGISDARISGETGIDPSLLHSPDKQIPLEYYLRLWELAIEVIGDPALGLHLPKYYDTGQSHFVTGIIFSSPTLLDGLKQWIRYAALVCDCDRFELRESDDFVTLVYANISLDHKNRWSPELYFSLMVEQFQQAINGKCAIEEIWMAHKAPGYANEYEAVFKTKLQFNMTEYHVRWKRKNLDIPIKTHDPYYHSLLKKYADDSLQSRKQTELFSEKIKRTIIEHLPKNQADIQTIADLFHMDRRTLLRKLKLEGTTFKELLEDTRKILAHDYLAQGLSITQVSFVLGFTATSSFQVAFKRWYKQSPGDYRSSYLA